MDDEKKKRKISVTLDAEVVGALMDAAQEQDCSVSEYINKLMRMHFCLVKKGSVPYNRL